MEILRTENLTFYYPERNIPTVNNVSLSIKKGEFITICGATGSGKSTFLKLLKPEITPKGEQNGKIFFKGKSFENITSNDSASSIGYVMQRPEQQIVTDKVWHELSFGLENMNIPSSVISKRISEMSSYFGIEDLFDKNVNTLSGGQKQILNLASVLVMDPEILLLDEPTSQLDPIAASEFISILKKINREMGITIIIIEHRLDELISITDKMIVFSDASVEFFDSPQNIAQRISLDSELINFFPISLKLAKSLCFDNEYPLSTKEGRQFIEKNFCSQNKTKKIEIEEKTSSKKIALELKNVFFKYDRKQNDVLSYLDLKVYQNEVFTLLGGNGSGKSTLLSAISGLLTPYSGSVKVFDKPIKEYKNNSLYDGFLSYLPQDVQTLFSFDSVSEELNGDLNSYFDFTNKKEMHPYDLSAGEQQLLALCKILRSDPKIILLDEPTKGIDPLTKTKILEIIKKLKEVGKTIFIVTHDIEFAAECSDRCALLFKGRIASVDSCKAFFEGNRFYTTVSSKIASKFFSNVVTLNDLIFLCKKNNKERINDYN